VDFSKWFVLFSDERVVSLTSPDSNYKAAAEEFLSKVPVPSSQILKIKEGLTAEQAAEHYAGQMLDLNSTVLPRTDDSMPILDMVLLGVGPDGHVASLFPNSAATAATHGWVLPVTNSPKPPSERITLTMPVINAARNVVVSALGEGKAEVVQRALEVQSLPGALPVQLVRPQDSMHWILDKASAASLHVDAWEEKKKFPRNTF
jgi:6-phosphogluconolactonase